MAIKAFPTAYGAGAYATGGRGYPVFKVTNLNDSGAGSFRQACTDVNNSGGGNIVFDVSGIIVLQSPIFAYIDNCTIAGQTAPEGGITIAGDGSLILESFDNSIIRYVRFRPEFTSNNDDVLAAYRTSNFIIDHCSILGGTDEGLDITFETDTFTVQNCMFGMNATGSIAGNSDNNLFTTNFSYLNNVFYNTSHRFPNVHVTGQADLINNLIWNYVARMSVVSGDVDLNHINNYYASIYGDGPNLDLGRMGMLLWWRDGEGTPSIYTEGNILHDTPSIFSNNWDLWHWRFDAPPSSGYAGLAEEPVPVALRNNTQFSLIGASLPIRTAQEIKDNLIYEAGANARLDSNGNVLSDIDIMDQHIIDNISTNTKLYYNTGNFGDEHTQYIRDYWATVSTTPLATRNDDTNGDGIPDAWTTANIPVGQTYSDIAPSGYTWLEEYINQVDIVNNIPQITRTDSNPTTIEIGGTYTPPTGTWTDVEDGSGNATVGGDTVDVNTIGTYNVTLSHTDTDGNTGTLIIPYTVIDTSTNIIYSLTEQEKEKSKRKKLKLVKRGLI